MLGIVALGLIVMAALAAGWLAYRSRLQLAADKAAREAKEEARVAAVRAHAELTRAIGVAKGGARAESAELARALELELNAHRGDTRAQAISRLRRLTADAGHETARILGDARL